MANISSTSGLTGTLTTALGQIGRKKPPSRDEIFAAQDAAQEAKTSESNAAKTEFLKFAKMSPAERIRAAYLKDHNLTEESLAQLSKEERMKIEEEIKKLIKTKLGLDEAGGAGQITDITV